MIEIIANFFAGVITVAGSLLWVYLISYCAAWGWYNSQTKNMKTTTVWDSSFFESLSNALGKGLKK